MVKGEWLRVNGSYLAGSDDRQSRAGLRVERQWKIEKIPATNGERAEAMVRQQLSKLGDTPFEAEEVRVEWSQPYFLPAATLNAWRREVVEAMLEQMKRRKEVRIVRKSDASSVPDSPSGIPEALMTCKYCLLYEMGCCKKRNPRKTGVPTYLRRGDLLLRIETDCKECVMKLKKA